MRRRKLLLILFILIMLTLDYVSASASSNVPYQTYNYDYWQDVYYTPAAYIPAGNLSGMKLGVGAMAEPLDIFVAEDGQVFIADTGNNRIIILDSELKNPRLIEGFDNQGTADSFNKPSGVYVTPKNELYIADTANKRIVALKQDGSLLKIISNPTSEVLADDFDFAPLKVTVDYADRVYVIAKGKIQGILAFDPNGDFTGFVGTIKVSISAYEKFWRRFSTKAQRKRQLQFIPTEFTGVDIAPDGFIYATNVDPDAVQSVRRINPKGQDVIKKNTNNSARKGTLSGDLHYRVGDEYAGPSRIVDVVYRGNGIYSILDMIRGRIFTYDHEGNLLYIFGGMGTQEGTFRLPAAIEMKGDKILVLDSERGEIVSFVATEYGKLIDQAVALRYDGDETAAVGLWEKVLELDSNFELAYVGIGKAYLAAGDNKTAMKYLKLGMERNYYSIAYKRYRDEMLKGNLGYILTGITLLAAAIIIRRLIKYRKLKGGYEDE